MHHAAPVFIKRMGKRILIVTEKPSAAKSIAAALGVSRKKNGCYENEEYTVAWCVGHLVEPAPPERYGEEWKTWRLERLPLLPEHWKYEVKKETEKQYRLLAGFFSGASEIYNACDAGREGQLIFRLAYGMAGCTKPVRRLWLSSMEEKAILEGMKEARPDSSYDGLYQSALCRQRADWLFGINCTRLFTALYGGRILKVGRVQTPVLSMIVEREKEIDGFKRVPYYCVHICGSGIRAVSGRMEKEDAESLADACRDGKVVVDSLKHEEKSSSPPKLYDLTALQRDADHIFGFTAKQTLSCLQGLYEKKLATYPRTDSRYLTDDMSGTAQKAASAAVSAFPDIFAPADAGSVLDVSVLLNSAKVSDHHALILTEGAGSADISTLSENERKILSLVACRLLCAAGGKHNYRTSRVEVSCGGQVFAASGKNVTDNGWKDFEDAFRKFYKEDGNRDAENEDSEDALDGDVLSKFIQGQEFDVTHVEVKEYYTQPPERFTDGSLLAAMERAGSGCMTEDVERRGLGTPATRADIIEKLVSDGFVKRRKKSLIPTEEGMGLASVLPDAVKSPELTAEWENSLALVAAGKMEADTFMDRISEMVSGLVRDHADAPVSEDAKKLFARGRTLLGVCPKCGGQIVKGKYGAYCEGKCGMSVAKYYSTPFTDSQVKRLLAGEKILLKGMQGRDGRPYDLCLEPTGIEEYCYEKDGKTTKGFRFVFHRSFLPSAGKNSAGR